MGNKKDSITSGVKGPKTLSAQADDVKITEGTTPTYYECVVCNQMKEKVTGQKVGVYLKETLGTRSGFICPDCATLVK